jgi:hypothetical protein
MYSSERSDAQHNHWQAVAIAVTTLLITFSPFFPIPITTMADDAAKKAEIEAYFKQQMEESKKLWSMRGKEARIQAHAARMNGPKTWRQLKGMELMIHEMKHAGNRPFVTGLV